MTRRCFGVALAFALIGLTLTVRDSAAQGITFDQEPITLVTETGRHDFTVDIADNPSKTELGLRYRHSVEPDGGLLIVQSIRAPMQMQVSTDGLSLHIDLLFIASDGTIKEVYPWVPVDSTKPIVSAGPVAAALEVAGGTITRFGILPGDRVLGAGLGP
jgi:uncharacterized protein